MEHNAGDPQLSPADALEQQLLDILPPAAKESRGAQQHRARARETVFNRAAVVFERDDSGDCGRPAAEGVSRYGKRRRTQTQRLDDELAAAAAAQRAERVKRTAERRKVRGSRNHSSSSSSSSDDDGDEDEDEDWNGASDESDDDDDDDDERSRGRGRRRTRTAAGETQTRYTFTRKTRCVSYAEDSDSDEFLDEVERAMVREERRAAGAAEDE